MPESAHHYQWLAEAADILDSNPDSIAADVGSRLLAVCDQVLQQNPESELANAYKAQIQSLMNVKVGSFSVDSTSGNSSDRQQSEAEYLTTQEVRDLWGTNTNRTLTALRDLEQTTMLQTGKQSLDFHESMFWAEIGEDDRIISLESSSGPAAYAVSHPKSSAMKDRDITTVNFQNSTPLIHIKPIPFTDQWAGLKGAMNVFSLREMMYGDLGKASSAIQQGKAKAEDWHTYHSSLLRTYDNMYTAAIATNTWAFMSEKRIAHDHSLDSIDAVSAVFTERPNDALSAIQDADAEGSKEPPKSLEECMERIKFFTYVLAKGSLLQKEQGPMTEMVTMTPEQFGKIVGKDVFDAQVIMADTWWEKIAKEKQEEELQKLYEEGYRELCDIIPDDFEAIGKDHFNGTKTIAARMSWITSEPSEAYPYTLLKDQATTIKQCERVLTGTRSTPMKIKGVGIPNNKVPPLLAGLIHASNCAIIDRGGKNAQNLDGTSLSHVANAAGNMTVEYAVRALNNDTVESAVAEENINTIQDYNQLTNDAPRYCAYVKKIDNAIGLPAPQNLYDAYQRCQLYGSFFRFEIDGDIKHPDIGLGAIEKIAPYYLETFDHSEQTKPSHTEASEQSDLMTMEELKQLVGKARSLIASAQSRVNPKIRDGSLYAPLILQNGLSQDPKFLTTNTDGRTSVKKGTNGNVQDIWIFYAEQQVDQAIDWSRNTSFKISQNPNQPFSASDYIAVSIHPTPCSEQGAAMCLAEALSTAHYTIKDRRFGLPKNIARNYVFGSLAALEVVEHFSDERLYSLLKTLVKHYKWKSETEISDVLDDEELALLLIGQFESLFEESSLSANEIANKIRILLFGLQTALNQPGLLSRRKKREKYTTQTFDLQSPDPKKVQKIAELYIAKRKEADVADDSSENTNESNTEVLSPEQLKKMYEEGWEPIRAELMKDAATQNIAQMVESVRQDLLWSSEEPTLAPFIVCANPAKNASECNSVYKEVSGRLIGSTIQSNELPPLIAGIKLAYTALTLNSSRSRGLSETDSITSGLSFCSYINQKDITAIRALYDRFDIKNLKGMQRLISEQDKFCKFIQEVDQILNLPKPLNIFDAYERCKIYIASHDIGGLQITIPTEGLEQLAEYYFAQSKEAEAENTESIEVKEYNFSIKERARITDAALDVTLGTFTNDEDHDFDWHYQKSSLKLSRFQQNKFAAVRQIVNVLQSLEKRTEQVDAVRDFAQRQDPGFEKSWNDLGRLIDQAKEFYEPNENLQRWIRHTITDVTDVVFTPDVIANIEPKEFHKLLLATSQRVEELVHTAAGSEKNTQTTVMHEAIMLGITRHCRTLASERSAELFCDDFMDREVVSVNEEYIIQSKSPVHEDQITKTREYLNAIAKTWSTTVTQMKQSDIADISDAASMTTDRASTVDIKNLLEHFPHIRDQVLYVNTDNTNVYLSADPHHHVYTLGQQDGGSSTILSPTRRINEEVHIPSHTAKMTPDGVVLDPQVADRSKYLPEDTRLHSDAQKIRGAYAEIRPRLDSVLTRYSVLANRVYLGSRIFIENEGTIYFACHKSHETEADAVFKGQERSNISETGEQRIALCKIDDTDLQELLSEEAGLDLSNWIVYELPETLTAPIQMEDPFDQTVMGADEASIKRKKMRAEGAEKENPEVYARCEQLSILANRLGLQFSIKPGGRDNRMYRFARQRLHDEIEIPEDFYQGYWRVKLEDPATGKMLRIAVCDMKGEGTFLVYDDDNSVPDSTFAGKGTKQRIQREHGGVFVRYDDDQQWNNRMEHFLEEWFTNDRRFFSFAHTEPKEGYPGLYKPNVGTKTPEIKALQRDLLKVAQLRRGEGTQWNVSSLNVSDFKNLDPDEADLSFRGVRGGKGGPSYLLNAAVYLGMTSKEDIEVEDVNGTSSVRTQIQEGDKLTYGLRVESMTVQDANNQVIVENALQELKRLAFGSKSGPHGYIEDTSPKESTPMTQRQLEDLESQNVQMREAMQAIIRNREATNRRAVRLRDRAESGDRIPSNREFTFPDGIVVPDGFEVVMHEKDEEVVSASAGQSVKQRIRQLGLDAQLQEFVEADEHQIDEEALRKLDIPEDMIAYLTEAKSRE